MTKYTKDATRTGRRQFVALAGASTAAVALAELPSAARAAESAAGGQTYSAGTYTASAYGKKSDVAVEVVFSENAIESVEVTGCDETARIAAAPCEQIPAFVVANQSLDVDAVAGATFTSNAVISAIEDCVAQAGGDVDALRAVEVAKETPEPQELEADIVVVGAGASGMTMAMYCAMKGAKVVLFEKCANTGGNALVSGGVMIYIDAPEDMKTDITDDLRNHFESRIATASEIGFPAEITDTLQADFDAYYKAGTTKTYDSVAWQALDSTIALGVSAYSDEMYGINYTYYDQTLPLLKWLNSFNINWTTPLFGIAGYPWPDWTKPADYGCGEGYFRAYDDYRAENSIPLDILFSTPADELVVDETGRVSGVHGVCSDGTEYTATAKTAVVLATGGFSGNFEMIKEHNDEWDFGCLDFIPTTNGYGHTGDGVKMAQEVGAAFVDSDPNYMIFPMANGTDWSIESMVGDSGNALMVNLEGKRFVDETLGRNAISKAEMAQTDGRAWLISDAENSKVTNGKNFQGLSIDRLIADKKAYRADTLEELAEQIGIDPDTLVATVQQYNEYAAAAYDPDFGRSKFDASSAVDEGPFFAEPLTWAMHITNCGLAVNWENYAILDAEGNEIPGLYGIGEVVPTTGGIMTMSNAMVLGDYLLGA